MEATEFSIKVPPVKPRRLTRVVGQKSSLGIVELTQADLARYGEINDSLVGSRDFMPRKTSDELKEEIEKGQPGHTTRTAVWTFGVFGSELVAEAEKGQLQGWIKFYQDDYKGELVQTGTISNSTGNWVLEASYVKVPGASEGQMASALRQSCMRISQIEAARDTINKKDSSLPQSIITAYAYSDNIASVRVLEKSGFVDKGPIPEDLEPGEKPDGRNIFVLDWEILNQMVHQKSDSELFKL